MDRSQAKSILARQLARYRTKSYAVSGRLIGKLDVFDVTEPDGVIYQIEIQVMWDDKPEGDIRVIGAIDDAGWRAFIPLTDSFIMTPEGRFLGE